MNKKFTTLVLSLLAITSLSANEKCEISFAGTPWETLGISGNGRFIVGTRQYSEAYCYDSLNERLFIAKAENEYDDMCFKDVTDSGVVIGKGSANLPAIYNFDTSSWEYLPAPTGYTEGYANEITPDGKTIAGYLMGKVDPTKPYSVTPCIWRLQDDGTYKFEELPDPETDFLGTKTQFVSIRNISSDGNIVMGVMVEEKGIYYQVVIYRYDGTEWSYDMPFVDMTFNGGPDLYAEWMAKEPKLNEYVDTNPGDEAYMDQVEEYQEMHAKWQYEFWSEFKTGTSFSIPPIVVSGNGKWIAPLVSETEYSWKAGELNISIASEVSYPALYNVETGELKKYEHITSGFFPFAVSDYGDMVSSDGYDFYILPAGSNDKIELSEWLKNEYDFDLMAALPSNTEYIDCCTVSPDMKVLVGAYRSVTADGNLDSKEVFCVKLPGFMSSVMQVLNTPTTESIKVVGDEMRFSDTAQNIKIYNLAGRMIMDYEAEAAMLDISDIEKGIYVVVAEIAGQKVTGKVYVD